MKMGAVMNEVKKREFAETISGLTGPFAQASSDAARRFCEQGQTFAKTMAEWNTEWNQFLSHRAARNGEALGRMTKCQNFSEVFAIQSEWVRDAADDYLKEMSKLMEANSRIMSGLLGSVGKFEMQPSTETRPSTARGSMRAAA
jgi:Phasin protein